MIENREIQGLLAGEHSSFAHLAFFESVCDSIRKADVPTSKENLYFLRRGAHLFNTFWRRELFQGDIILSESIFEYPSLYKRLLNKKLKIIELFASPKIFKMYQGELDPFSSALFRSLICKVDGFVTVSKMCAGFLKDKGIEAPLEIIYPFINDEKYKILSGGEYSPESKTIVCIGFPTEYKGIDLAIKVFDKLANKDKNLKLRIITKELLPKYLAGVKNADKITVGPIPNDVNFCNELQNALLCLHFGRYDTFPISTLETMLAGVPTFVSNLTGTREVTETVDKKFVLGFDEAENIERLEWFFTLSQKEKIKDPMTLRS